jgi:hypothetical protein
MAVSGRGDKLSHYQEKAIPALLTTPTLSEAAAAAGVGERTLSGGLQTTLSLSLSTGRSEGRLWKRASAGFRTAQPRPSKRSNVT